MDTRRLHDLVTELGEIEDAQAWVGIYQDTPSRVYISWSEGAGSAGYSVVQCELEDIVKCHYREFLTKVWANLITRKRRINGEILKEASDG